MKHFNKIKVVKVFSFAFLLLVTQTINAQVGIGTTRPDSSAMLDVSSSTRGFLPPRMTAGQRNSILTPAAGLMIWCKDCQVSGELQIYNGTMWTNVAGGDAAIPGSVNIGTQVWTTRNLDVTSYGNGDTIPEVKDAAIWDTLTTGAWCYYNNDSAAGAIYGKLYNHAAVVDPRGLAPKGWHIPTRTEFTNLNNYLGELVAGRELKEQGTSHWTSPNTDATNNTRFTGLPGGYRLPLQPPGKEFANVGYYGYFWSSESFGTARYLNYNTPYFSELFSTTNVGFSVRCIKD